MEVKFYLDYVGCKAYMANMAEIESYSFISTMWDVKLLIYQQKTLLYMGFISTMWDVKL